MDKVFPRPKYKLVRCRVLHEAPCSQGLQKNHPSAAERVFRVSLQKQAVYWRKHPIRNTIINAKIKQQDSWKIRAQCQDAKKRLKPF
ncbi:MAG: hypothetical protein CSB23_02565 [Deltaproteobacteria bacterium]|nr:MAG: hypothetical protein CSB23_02565 [Deltaproteobacteria bacterium]